MGSKEPGLRARRDTVETEEGFGMEEVWEVGVGEKRSLGSAGSVTLSPPTCKGSFQAPTGSKEPEATGLCFPGTGVPVKNLVFQPRSGDCVGMPG